MSSLLKMKENLSAQIAELEALQSVYPEELKFSDYQTLIQINDLISGCVDNVSARLEYSIKITVAGESVDMSVSLSSDYPVDKPDVYVRGTTLSRDQQRFLNDALLIFIKSQDTEEPIIYDIVIWLQENLDEYLKNSKKKNNCLDGKKNNNNENDEGLEFRRYWIYSHHIKCGIKRKIVVDEANANGLTGFSLIGKPGIICIEGLLDDCECWWLKIKSMIWQKIGIKHIEKEKATDNKDIENLRKFKIFEELIYPVTEGGGSRMGRLLNYLTEHQSQHIFKEYFGVEGKSTLT